MFQVSRVNEQTSVRGFGRETIANPCRKLSLTGLLLSCCLSLPSMGESLANNQILIPSTSHQCELQASSTRTDPVTSDELQIDEESYSSELEAVISASNYFNPLSIEEDREYIGAILKHKRQGHFIYTVSSGESGADQASARIRVPSDYEITAFWHTHGNHHWTRKYFSDVDTQLAKQWKLPFYMAEASGRLRVYQPNAPTLSVMQTRKLGLGSNRGYAKGKSVSVDQRKVKLATTMDQWLALHQAPATAAEETQLVNTTTECDNIVEAIATSPGHSQS